MNKNFFLLLALLMQKDIFSMEFGISKRFIETKNDIAQTLKIENPELSEFDASILAAVPLVHQCAYTSRLFHQLEDLRSKFSYSKRILDKCNDGICQVNAHIINFVLELSAVEIRERNELARSIALKQSELSEEDSITIASTFFLKDKDYVPQHLFAQLEKIRNKSDRNGPIYKICDTHLEKLHYSYCPQVGDLLDEHLEELFEDSTHAVEDFPLGLSEELIIEDYEK